MMIDDEDDNSGNNIFEDNHKNFDHRNDKSTLCKSMREF